MKFKFSIPVLAAALAFSSTVAFQTEVQAQNRSRNSRSSQPTVFHCVAYQDSDFATVAVRGANRSNPMIIWESYAFGHKHTPLQRCQTVSRKLTRAVAHNGGRLAKLLLTTGTLNGQTVICYVNTGVPYCTPSNTLFTLGAENAKNPGVALARLLRFGKKGSDSPLRESTPVESNVVVDLEEAVEGAFAPSSEQTSIELIDQHE